VARDVLWRALVLMGSGVALGGGLLLFFLALREEDVARFAVWVGVTAAVMLGTGLAASIAPARRALRISPADALREV
jgi:ABC-type antimicrobial peptide transport system permease subunit